MRKKLVAFLLILCMCMTGCSQTQNPSAEGTEQDISSTIKKEEVLEKYLSNLDILESPIREYGEDTGFVQLDEELMVRILYPEGELADLEKKITDWVDNTVAYYQVEAKGSSDRTENIKS